MNQTTKLIKKAHTHKSPPSWGHRVCNPVYRTPVYHPVPETWTLSSHALAAVLDVYLARGGLAYAPPEQVVAVFGIACDVFEDGSYT